MVWTVLIKKIILKWYNTKVINRWLDGHLVNELV